MLYLLGDNKALKIYEKNTGRRKSNHDKRLTFSKIETNRLYLAGCRSRYQI